MVHDEREAEVDQRQVHLLGQQGQLLDRVELALVVRAGQVVAIGNPVRPAALHLGAALAPAARQPTTAERTPRDRAHAIALDRGQRLALDRPVEQRIRRLLADEALAVPALGHPLRLDDRRGRVGRAAEIADLARLHEVRQRAERLVVIAVGLQPVDLVQVDVVGAEPPQAVLDRLHDPASRRALVVRVGAHREVAFRRQHDVVALPAQRLGEDLLRLARRRTASAVSMKLMPASSAACVIRMQSSWSVLPHPPNIIAPRQNLLTLTPVRPSVRYSMVTSLPAR